MTVRDGTGQRRSREASSAGAPARLRFAVTRLDAGDSYTALRSKLVERFRISARTAERVIARAYEEIARAFDFEAPTMAARISGRLWNLSVRAERRGRDAIAIAALRELIRWHAPPANVSASVAVNTTVATAESMTFLQALRLKGGLGTMADLVRHGLASPTELDESLRMTAARRQAEIDKLEKELAEKLAQVDAEVDAEGPELAEKLAQVDAEGPNDRLPWEP